MPLPPVIAKLVDVVCSGQAAFLCGAGASAPSGLPLAADFITVLLRTLRMSHADIRLFTAGTLPFESYMEVLQLESPQADHLKIFHAGKPSLIHWLLAALMKEGKVRTLCTTNFDLLFERALEGADLAAGSGYDLVYRDEDFEHIDWGCTKPLVIKIHGSADDQAEMAITLSRVAAQLCIEGRSSVIRSVFSKSDRHQAVVVLGYSGSDNFDINPILREVAAEGKTVFLVNHNPGTKIQESEIRELSDEPADCAFYRFPGYRIRCDAGLLAEDLWRRLAPQLTIPVQQDAEQIKAGLLTQWENTLIALPETSRAAVPGTLWFRVSEFNRSLDCYRKSLIALGGWNHLRRAELLTKIGDAQRNLGQLEDALQSYMSAAEAAERGSGQDAHVIGIATFGTSSRRLQISTAVSVANALLNLGRYNGIVELLRQTAGAAAMLQDDQLSGKVLGSLAEALFRTGAIQESAQCMRRAIDLARNSGDLRALAGRLGNLGQLLFQMNRAEEAEANFREAMSISVQTNDRKGQAMMLGSLGSLSFQCEDWSKAREFNLQSLELAQLMDDEQGQARALGNLGLAEEHLGNIADAIEHYKESLHLARRIGDREVEKNAHNNLRRLGFF